MPLTVSDSSMAGVSGLFRTEQPLVRAVLERIDVVVSYTGVLLPSALAVLVLLALLHPDRVLFSKPRTRKELYHLPGLPLVGNLFDMLRMDATQSLEAWLSLLERSPFASQISMPGSPASSIVMLHRPEYIEYVQKTNFENYEKGQLFRSRFEDLLGSTGIFVADGHEWKVQRKMASHIFSVYQFRTWVQSVVHEELQSVVGLLDTLAAQGSAEKGRPSTLVLPNLASRYTLSSFAKMAFGNDVHCLSSDPKCLDEEEPFAKAFDQVQEVISIRFMNPFWRFTERITKQGRLGRRNVQQIRAFGGQIVDQRLKERRSGVTEKEAEGRKDGKDLLDLFMDLTTDRQALLEIVLNFLIAGRDTSMDTISWLFYELMAHPEHVEEIRREVREVLLDPTDGSLKLLAYDQIKSLPFTTACINETLRLHPPVPKNGKRAVKDDVIIPQGPTAAGLAPIKVHAGEQVGWCDWAIARNPNVWGPDAAEYEPYRFIETDEGGVRSVKNFGQWKFHVFNGGPRLCLGMTLAMYEVLAFTAAVIDRFDFGWATAEQGQQAQWPLRYNVSVTHPSQNYTATVARSK